MSQPQPVPIGCTIPIAGPTADPETLVTLAQTAERLGFDSVWVSDHVVVPERIDSAYPYSVDGAFPSGPSTAYLEPLTMLAYLAGCTSTIRLGTNVLILPYRNPVLTAKVIATLDVLSRGRVDLGIGVGWMREEFEALGYDYYAQRGAVTEEQVRVMQALWTEDRPAFEGSFYRFDRLGAYPHPFQRPHPPIWIGGHTRAAIRRAARYGDGWLPIGARPPANLPPAELAAKVQMLRTEAARLGRDPAAIKIAFSTTVDFEAADRPFSGSPEHIARDLLDYRAVGVDRFVLGFGPASSTEYAARMQRFAEQVAPLVAAASAEETSP